MKKISERESNISSQYSLIRPKSPTGPSIQSSPATPTEKNDGLRQMKIAKELMSKLDKLVGRASRPDAVTLITSADFA